MSGEHEVNTGFRTSRHVPRALQVVAVLLIVAGSMLASYRLGLQQGTAHPALPARADASTSRQTFMVPDATPDLNGEGATRRHMAHGIKAGDIDPASGRKVLYYHDPMVPGQRFQRPAKSPFMDMMLVPVLADATGAAGAGSGDDGSQISVSSRVAQNLGLRTATVTEGTLAPVISVTGSIAYNEREQVLVQARAAGVIERLHVRATLDPVRRGQVLAEMWVPEWIALQEEFLALRRMQAPGLAGLQDAARQRMRQGGMAAEQVALVERSDQVQPRLALTAPIDGVVSELSAREGLNVMTGSPLFRIHGLARVWADAEVPESQAALIRPGAPVQARSAAAPGRLLQGKVQAILPEVNPLTRTIKARVVLDNPGKELLPGMFVSLQLHGLAAEKTLIIPSEALIRTGQRTLVMLAQGAGHFRPVEVQTGLEVAGQTAIVRGLQAGQQVVISAQFLLDSEASLKGLEAHLNGSPPASKTGAARTTSAPARQP